MYTVGVTGGIGSGKTTVCKVFAVLGIPVFNSDNEAKRLMQEDAGLRAQLAEAFGTSIFHAHGTDRRALAELVFNDSAALQRLNGLVHPAVRNAFARWTAVQQASYVVNEAAILVETKGHEQLDHLVVVSAPEELRIAWVMQRDKASEADVRARMRNQADDAMRLAAADSVVVNDGHTLVIPQVLAIHQQLLQLAAA